MYFSNCSAPNSTPKNSLGSRGGINLLNLMPTPFKIQKKRCFHFFGCKVTLLRGIIRNFGGNFPSPKPFFFGAQKLEKHHKTASKIRNSKEPCINVGYGLVANGINLRIGHSWAWRGVVSTNTAPTQNGNLWYKDAM